MDAKIIGKKLKELRGDRAIAEVASQVGITPAALSNYENGIRIPRDAIKIKLAGFYRMTVQHLFYA